MEKVIEYEYEGDLKTVTSVTIPDGVTAIGMRALAGCSNLKSIHCQVV